jgi:hypothetical protein
VRPNDGSERRGHIRIGERFIEVSQAAAPRRACPESVTPSSISAPASASEGVFSVIAAPTCTWSASADVPWIRAKATGTDSGAYSLLENQGDSARSGRIQIGDQAISVTQAARRVAPACTYVIDLAPTTFNLKGDALTITITTQTGCPWSMTTAVDWITPSSAKGTGSGKVGAKVLPTGSPRKAIIVVNDRSFTVEQSRP